MDFPDFLAKNVHCGSLHSFSALLSLNKILGQISKVIPATWVEVDVKFMSVVDEVKKASHCKTQSLWIILQNTQQCTVLIPSGLTGASQVQQGQWVK